jgi:rod shape-determining protein MreD
MIINLLKYSVVFIVSVLLQVLLFNNILIFRVIAPFFYILFILLLPFYTPRALLLFLSFVLGLTVDIFTNTPGVHASACLLTGFLRPGVLRLITSRETLESVNAPRVESMGLQWFAGYTTFLVIIHHFFLFFIEAFTFEGFLITMLRVVLSSVLSVILILLSQFIIFRK